jgi:hypothetical protein
MEEAESKLADYVMRENRREIMTYYTPKPHRTA